MNQIKDGRLMLVLGGLAASLILAVFGIVAIVTGIQGRNEVQDTLAREHIVGTADSTIPGLLVNNGSRAQAMADVMREHTLKSSGGLTYADMGRFKIADGSPKGTNDAALAVKDAQGLPVSNSIRDLWISETALTTALNTAYFAEQVGTFAIVMGIALTLTAVGFVVLTLGALWHRKAVDNAVVAPAPRTQAVEATSRI